ncbi:Bug family tripartite tricarboxylate transporter substrate binding protein [Advenella kashmirensis]
MIFSNRIRTFALATVMLVSTNAFAQAADSNPINLIVPYAPGGGVDTTTRVVAQALSTELKRQVVVINRGGAGSTIGTNQAAKAPPDGRTLLYAGIGLAFQPAIFKNLPYDPKRDLEQIATTGRQPYILAIGPSLKVKNLAELVAESKKRPDGLTFGTPGKGSPPHIVSELLLSTLGIKATHVPYKGGSPAVIDLVGGRIDMVVGTTTLMTPHIKSGDLKGLAVTSSERTKQLPDLPTVAEQGFNDFQFYTWSGIFAPAGTPDSFQTTLNEAMARALAHPQVKEVFDRDGFESLSMPNKEAQQFYLKELEHWPAVIRKLGIQPE